MILKIKCFIILIIIICDAFAQSNCISKVDSVRNSIKKDLVQLIDNDEFNSILNYMNIFWPDSNQISKNMINENTLTDMQKLYAKFWFNGLTGCSWHRDQTIYVANMKNGDDWIIGYSDRCGTYVQMIDGRTLTIVINETIDVQDTINLSNRFLKLTKKYFNNSTFNINEPRLIALKSKQDLLIGAVIDIIENIKDKELYEIQNLVWLNDKYTIIDIFKKKKPYKSRGIAYGRGDKFIGSIPRNDPRPFRRFSKEEKINFTSEMHKVYPWAVDSFLFKSD